jgi:DNA-binding beta-propeller fold protein YncE
LSYPWGLAFNSAGDLFEADDGSHNINEFTPGGAESAFVTVRDGPLALAFDSAGNLFVGEDSSAGNIYVFTPSGFRSVFASGLDYPEGLAFQPVPEPSALGLLAVGVLALFVRRHRHW